MNEWKKILFIFLLFLLINTSVFAMEVCQMSEEYQRWLNLNDEERELFDVPVYCASSYGRTINKLQVASNERYSNIFSNYISTDSANVNSTRYNATEEGYVTSAKDQLSTNSCWAFAGLSLVETAALKGGLGSLDLSERHVEYGITRNAFTDGVRNTGLNRSLDGGGNAYFTASYFFRHEGPLLETSMPFQSTNSKISLSAYPTDKAVLDVTDYTARYYDLGTGCDSTQISVIKEKVIKYGSAGVSIYYDGAYLKGGQYYYYNGTNATNHAVVVVGWDDSIAVSNFYNSPSTKGAWIVKNSWGTSYGDNGFFYVSYSDRRVCTNISTFSSVSVNTYDNAYNAADTLSNLSFTYNSTIYAATKFTKKSSEKEYLDKVSIEVSAGTSYTVYISKTNNLTNSSTWTTLGSGTATEIGVKSIKFSPIELTGDYTIIVKYTNGLFPAMCKTTYSNQDMHYYMEVKSGVNYYSEDGSTWDDMASVSGSAYSGCEPVIYAYTKNASTGTPSFNITSLQGTSSDVFTRTDDYYVMKVTSSNILSYQLFSIYIYSSQNTDATKYFEISDTIANGMVTIKPLDDCPADTYTVKLSYNGVVKSSNMVIKSLLESSKYTIDGEYIIVSLGSETTLSKSTFISNLTIFNNSYKVLDSAGSDITSSTSVVGTNMKINVNGNNFTVVVMGDISGDGKILSNDALLISRHITYISRLDDAQVLAADVSGDGQVLSNDALLISRFLVGMRNSL